MFVIWSPFLLGLNGRDLYTKSTEMIVALSVCTNAGRRKDKRQLDNSFIYRVMLSCHSKWVLYTPKISPQRFHLYTDIVIFQFFKCTDTGLFVIFCRTYESVMVTIIISASTLNYLVIKKSNLGNSIWWAINCNCIKIPEILAIWISWWEWMLMTKTCFFNNGSTGHVGYKTGDRDQV